jgi:putative transposase
MRKEAFEYDHENHSVGIATVHLVWIPVRRKPVLRGDVAVRCREIFYQLAIEKRWAILALAVEPNHIHLFVRHQPKDSIAQIANAFKGRSSRFLRDEFPHLKKLPSLWTRSYWHSTAGKVSQAVIERYINDPHHTH